MMKKTVALIHTTRIVIEPIHKLFTKIIPEVRTINLLDEGILEILFKKGYIDSQVNRKVCNLAISAEETGADLIMLTCSSISPCADIACKMINIPLLKIDEVMVNKAVNLGKVIGVLATSKTTLQPTTTFIKNVAKEKNKDIFIKTYLCEEALKALLAGENDEHDKIILKKISEISKEVDVIVLAQASLERLLPKINKKAIKINVLSSPRMAIYNIKKTLEIQ